MSRNAAIAISMSALFLALGIAAAGGASNEAMGTLGIVAMLSAIGLVTRLDGPGG